MNIIQKYRMDILAIGQESDFILSHDRFEHPEFCLRDDVSLYIVNKTHAVFLQAKANWPKPPYMEDFYIIGQYESADKVITIPIDHFNKITEAMKDDGAKIIFLQNTSRCGSTLLTNIFKETGRCVCYGTPHCLSSVCSMIYTRKIWSGEQAKRIYRNVIRMMCKPYRGLEEKVLAYVIKPLMTCGMSIELTQEMLPDSHQFFIYRDPSTVTVSLRRTMEAVPSIKLLFHLPNIPNIMGFWLRLVGYPDVYCRDYNCVVHQDLEYGYRIAFASMHYYLKSISNGVNIRGIRYSQLVSEQEKHGQAYIQILRFAR